MAGSVEIVFSSIGGAGGEPVSPALPTVLRVLAMKDLQASFHLSAELLKSEPFADMMINNGRNEVVDGAVPETDARADKNTPPHEWHTAMQVAVGRAVRTGERSTLVFELAALERGDAMGYFDETIDLIAGLRRAGSLEVVGDSES